MLNSEVGNESKMQLLIEHLKNVAKIARSFDCLGIQNILYFTGLMHDICKANKLYQDYLLDNSDNIYKKGEIFHSLPSAQFAFEILKNNKIDPLIREIITMAIDAHHGGLVDGITIDGKYEFLERIDKEIKFGKTNINYEKRLNEVDAFIKKHITRTLDKIIDGIKKDTENLKNKLDEISKNKNADIQFFIHLITRYVYSCLVDADRLDARNFDKENTSTNTKSKKNNEFIELEKVFSKNLSYLNSKNANRIDKNINEFRSDISKKCLEASNENQGIYKFEVPTGGGKTLSSLRFALNHLIKHNLDRIIYVIPYLSITDQTAKSFREILNKEEDYETILEANSNFIPNEDKLDISEYEYMESRWDNNIIITTMVQFLESSFSNKASLQRKFHNFANSVIIFDEIQSLPPYTINMFNQLANFLNLMLNTTIILCSATQIPLDKTEHPIIYSQDSQLIKNNYKINLNERVKCILLLDKNKNILIKYEDDELAKKIVEEKQSSLVIVNTKNNAINLYKAINEYIELNNIKIDNTYCLTTYMCSEHRKEVIDKIKTDLKNKKYVICISTQLIEAGVDISFECVFRQIAGIDSIIQAAGRCNRNNEFNTLKNIYLFDLKDSNMPKELRYSSKLTELILNNEDYHNKLLSSEVISIYYDKFIENSDKELFDYCISIGKKDRDNDNIKLYDLHSSNKKFVQKIKQKDEINQKKYLGKCKIKCSFKEIAKHFKIISNNQISIIVPFNKEANNLINQIKNNQIDKILISKLNKYTINLYNHEFKKVEKFLEKINELFYVLDERSYLKDIGINLNHKEAPLVA